MGCYLLEVLFPAVISAFLLWDGVQCKKYRYSLEISSPMTVQVGLDVDIPCKFTYDTSRDDPLAKLYGYWYVEDKQSSRPLLVATSNMERIKEINPRVRYRFEVLEQKLSHGNCSLTIKNVEAADEGIYHFRMEKGRKRYSYSAAEEKLSVIVTERKPDVTSVPGFFPEGTPDVTTVPGFFPERKPDVTVPELLRAGQEASVFCTAHWNLSSGQPNITWTGISRGKSNQYVRHNRVESYIDFTPTAADHLQNITCKATYFRVPKYVTIGRTVILNVNYPPRKLQYNGHLIHPNGEVQYFTNLNQIVPQEGDSLVVRCEVDSNPESFVSWKLKFPGTRLYIYNNELRLSNVTSEEEGKYECQAYNVEGYIEGSIHIPVKGR